MSDGPYFEGQEAGNCGHYFPDIMACSRYVDKRRDALITVLHCRFCGESSEEKPMNKVGDHLKQMLRAGHGYVLSICDDDEFEQVRERELDRIRSENLQRIKEIERRRRILSIIRFMGSIFRTDNTLMGDENESYVLDRRDNNPGYVQSLPCPYGARTNLIIRDETGVRYARCMLADELKGKLSFFRPSLERLLSDAGCPQPIQEGFFSRAGCKFNSGDYKKL